MQSLMRCVPASPRGLADEQQRTSTEADAERASRLTGLVGAQFRL